MVCIKAYSGNSCIAYAKLSREGLNAKLVDIYVYDRRKIKFIFFRLGSNYRGKGVGTELLNQVLYFCKKHGIETIEGKVMGDLKRLIPWYRRFGFNISPENDLFYKFSEHSHLP